MKSYCCSMNHVAGWYLYMSVGWRYRLTGFFGLRVFGADIKWDGWICEKCEQNQSCVVNCLPICVCGGKKISKWKLGALKMCGLNWSKLRITVHEMSINGWNCAAGLGTRWKVDFLLLLCKGRWRSLCGEWVVDYRIRISGLVGRGSIHLKLKERKRIIFQN